MAAASSSSSIAALLNPTIPTRTSSLSSKSTHLTFNRRSPNLRLHKFVGPIRAAAAVETAATAESLVDKSVNAIRFLAIDAVEKANSGHPGLPMGCAPLAHVLFDEIMKYNPKNPYWFNRDRFVLSAGHGCMLHYALLHLAGYDSVKEEDLKAFRQWGSKTPGHPENFETPGIEVTTGPLGQGIANAVGLALAEKHLAARFNKPDNEIIDHYTYCILGDGCQMEGISNEACSLAGHWGLGKLIAFYDDNHISIDGDTEIAFTEDVVARFEALGWHTIWVKNGNTGYDDIRAAIKEAKAVKDKPTLIKVTTTIGYGSPNKANSYSVHGSALGAKEVDATRRNLGWPHEPFHVPEEVKSHWSRHIPEGAALETEWNSKFAEYEKKYKEDAEEFKSIISGELPVGWEKALPTYTTESPADATRNLSQQCLNALATVLPGFLGGSADLASSNMTLLKMFGNFQKDTPAERNLRFGVREHGMGAICNGIALHSPGLIPYCATFFVFTDYMRAAIRISALSEARVIYVMTHDSIGLGEDGPTHQPIEHLVSLRAMPNILMLRPADGTETAGAYRIAVLNTKRPSVLALSRQKLPQLPGTSVEGVEKGGYTISDNSSANKPDIILMATGSELEIAAKAADELRKEGKAVRVVSARKLLLGPSSLSSPHQNSGVNGIVELQMGGRGVFVDGVRRLFKRRNYGSATRLNEAEEEEDELKIVVDYDLSGLVKVRVPKRITMADPNKKSTNESDFFTEYGEASRYQIQEVVGKGSYGVVGSAVDTHTGEKVAIKKINDVFEHVSDATRILREIKLLRLLRHPDIVEIKHIMLPPSRREFRDIYVVFELMESDLHQVIKANDDLTPEHHQFFLYQLLRAMKYIHSANVFHRDLKPKNILANADCKLKVCDFGLARVSFDDAPSAIFWTDYVATRWYRAPELCGSFFSKYTPAIDIWSIGCIFAEMLSGKPLFPGKNVVHQLDLMTDLLGTPPPETIQRIRNEKAKRYLSGMRKKPPVPFSQKFPDADPLALTLLERLLAFDPKDRPSAEEALGYPYFKGLSNLEREPSTQPISKLEFEFERRKLTKDDVRELIYREILEYHPQMLQEYLRGGEQTSFMYPSGVDRFKRQFAHLEEHPGKGGKGMPVLRQNASLPRERVPNNEVSAAQSTTGNPAESQQGVGSEQAQQTESGLNEPNCSTRSLLKSASISASQCVVVKGKKDSAGEPISEQTEEDADELSKKIAALYVQN